MSSSPNFKKRKGGKGEKGFKASSTQGRGRKKERGVELLHNIRGAGFCGPGGCFREGGREKKGKRLLDVDQREGGKKKVKRQQLSDTVDRKLHP